VGHPRRTRDVFMPTSRKDPTQPALFDIDTGGSLTPVTVTPPLTGGSVLAAAITEFEAWMERKKMSKHTVASFRSDLNLLARYHGRGIPIHQLGTPELQEFLLYIREGRNVPCSPKSYQRRVTALKSFFKWLKEEEVLPSDPAESLIHLPVYVPLPDILFDHEIESMQAAAERARIGDKPDARPALLLALLLKTGMKKSEMMNLALEHFDFSRPDEPVVYIRYEDPKLNLKERKLALTDDFQAIYEEYLAQYAPERRLFECTPRNLEYVLRDLAESAAVFKGPDKLVSFEMLRITSAVLDSRNGMEGDTLRRKLGLSEITWRATGPKIEQLAAPAL
jgi:integrase/recombinase XerD